MTNVLSNLTVQILWKHIHPRGCKPDPSKVDAITKMESQSTKQELQSF